MSAKDNTASRHGRVEDRYEIARETIGIPEDSLWVFERNVYDRFVARLQLVVRRPEWHSYERQDPGWISDFADAYQECLQFAVIELAETITEWVVSKRRKADSEHIIQVSFLFADELRRPGLSKAWLACVVNCTKGPQLPLQGAPTEVLGEVGLIPEELSLIPDPDALGTSISSYFLRYLISPAWKHKAEARATLRILQREHLAHSGRSAAVKTPAPQLTWAEINLRPSRSIKEIAEALCVDPRTIRNYIKSGKLNRTAKRRVVVNEKLRSEFERVHSKDQHPKSVH